MAKIERTKNATRNIIFGLILRVCQIIIPFFMRTAMIYLLGIQYLGLNSLFTSILQVLNLAELGVGSAMVYSMYKPIAEEDYVTICALQKLYKKYYFIIGLVIAVVGGMLTPFVPRLITGEVPNDVSIYILYLMNLMATVLSYWVLAYKTSLFQAHQRVDIISKATLITSIVQYGLQLFVLCVLRNYYGYVIVALVTQLLTNVVIAYCSHKMYPSYKPQGDLPDEVVKKINQRIKDVFTAKLGGTITNSADTIVISAFLGLTSLAVYQNYYFILSSVGAFLSVLFGAVTAGIGNSLVTESKEKNYNDFKKFSFAICFILCICVCCFAGLYQPFMKIWVGEDYMLPNGFIPLFCLLFYCLELAMVWATFKDAAGLWHSDRFRPLIGSIVNLILNIVLVNIIGLYGIILSTIISYVFISMPWLIHNLFRLFYEKSLLLYIKEILLFIFVTLISLVCTCAVCSLIYQEGIIWLLIKAILCVMIPLIIQCALYSSKKEYIESKGLLVTLIKKTEI